MKVRQAIKGRDRLGGAVAGQVFEINGRIMVMRATGTFSGYAFFAWDIDGQGEERWSFSEANTPVTIYPNAVLDLDPVDPADLVNA